MKLIDALRQHGRDHEITKEEPAPLSLRLVVGGKITMPDRSCRDSCGMVY
jgi:hypothetical protein